MSLRTLKDLVSVTNYAGGGTLTAGSLLYCPGIGLLLNASSKIARLTLDGVFCEFADLTLDLTNYFWGYYPALDLPLYRNGGFESTLERQALCPTLLGANTMDSASQGYVRLADRWLAAGPTRCVTAFPFAGGSAVEADFSSGDWAGSGAALTQVGLGRTPTEILVAVGPEFFFYDTVQKVATSELFNLGIPTVSIAYIPEHRVVVSLHGNSPLQLAVWSLQVMPATVSDPVVDSESPQGGNVCTYKVQVLGASNEPCIGEVVSWSFTGEGDLLDSTSLTDEDGYARARVLYALTDVGSTTLTATVIQ